MIPNTLYIRGYSAHEAALVVTDFRRRELYPLQCVDVGLDVDVDVDDILTQAKRTSLPPTS